MKVRSGLILLLLMLTGLISYSGGTQIEYVKLAWTGQGYALIWVETPLSQWTIDKGSHIKFKHFSSFQQAEAYHTHHFPEFKMENQVGLSLPGMQIPKIIPAEGKTTLIWDRGEIMPIKMSFKTLVEAKFFQKQFHSGHYSRSVFGHSVLMTR